MRCVGSTFAVSGSLVAIAAFGTVVLLGESLRGARDCTGADHCDAWAIGEVKPELFQFRGQVLREGMKADIGDQLAAEKIQPKNADARREVLMAGLR